MLLLIPNFSIDVARSDAGVVVTVSGEVDICTADWLGQELRRAQLLGVAVVVDLERVEFMDCCGLRVLLSASADSSTASFAVTPGPRQVQKLFEITGAGALLHITPVPVGLDRSAA